MGPANAQLTYRWSLLLLEHIRRLNVAQRGGRRSLSERSVYCLEQAAERETSSNTLISEKIGNYIQARTPHPARTSSPTAGTSGSSQTNIKKLQNRGIYSPLLCKYSVIRPAWSRWFSWKLPTSTKSQKKKQKRADWLLLINQIYFSWTVGQWTEGQEGCYFSGKTSSLGKMEKGASVSKRDKTNTVGFSLLSDLAKSKKNLSSHLGSISQPELASCGSLLNTLLSWVS